MSVVYKDFICVTGDNSFACHQKLKELKDSFIKEYGEFAYQAIDCASVDFEVIKEAVNSPGFLSPAKLLILQAASKNKQLIENAETLVTGKPDSVTLVIYDENLDKRTSFYKFVSKNSEFLEFNVPNRAELARWLQDYVRQNNGQISPEDANYLIDRLGSNQALLANETDKLLLYDPEINRLNIDLLTLPSPQSSIFDLIEAAFAGNLAKADAIYKEQRAQKVEPQNITAMLTWQLHVLALIKTAGERNNQEIAREAKISPFVVTKSQKIANKMSYSRLKELISSLVSLDHLSKTKYIDLDEGLKNYLVKLSA